MKMLNLGKILIGFILTISLASASVVEAKLSDSSVPKGSIVTLQLIAHGSDIEFPTIKHIGKSPIISQNQSMKIYTSNINGKVVTDNQKVLAIEFEATNDMTIPPFSIKVDGKEYQTKPLQLHTTKPLPQSKQPYYLKFETTSDKVMTDEPFGVSVYFVVRDDVILATQPVYLPPKFDGFYVSSPKQHNYQNGNYNITKIDYILTPKAEGNYTITPPQAKIAVATSQADPFFGFSSDAKWYMLKAKPLHIQVLPKPSGVTLVGDFKAIAKIDKEQTKANKPVNLSIKIFGEGSLDDLELGDYDIDAVSVYSDDATIKTQIKDGKIYSSYIKTYAFISDHDFDIPSRTIRAYNLQTKQEYNITIPSYHISVTNSQATITPTATPTKPVVHTNITPTTNSKSTNNIDIKVAAWWSLLLAFIAGMLASFGLSKLNIKFKKPKLTTSLQDALTTLYPHISSDKKAEEMVKKLYAKLNGDKNITIDKKELQELLKQYKETKLKN
jgi:hypothetical protein